MGPPNLRTCGVNLTLDLGTQGQSPRLVDLWVCLSSPLGLSFSSMDRGLVPSRQPQSYGGHHETRSQGGDFGPTGPPAPQGSSTVPTLHPHLSVRTALDWKPTSASCVSTPLAESRSFIAGGLNTATSAPRTAQHPRNSPPPSPLQKGSKRRYRSRGFPGLQSKGSALLPLILAPAHPSCQNFL